MENGGQSEVSNMENGGRIAGSMENGGQIWGQIPGQIAGSTENGGRIAGSRARSRENGGQIAASMENGGQIEVSMENGGQNHRERRSLDFLCRSFWSQFTIAVVTGANRGIGYEIVRGLLKERLMVILTARDESKGKAAVNALEAERLPGLVFFHQLDVTSIESVLNFATWLQDGFGGFDILVNNAAIGVGPRGWNAGICFENASAIIATNYAAVRYVTEQLMPFLRPRPAGARIINVTCRASLYGREMPESVKKMYRGENFWPKQIVNSLAMKYLNGVRAGNWADVWTRTPMYTESKMLLNAYSRALANSVSKDLNPDARKIFVVSFCPGVTRTNIHPRAAQGGRGASPGFPVKNAEQGADTGVWLALLRVEQLGEKHGKFFAERTEFACGT